MEVAKPGVQGIEIVAEMERAARREGADHAKYWMASGPPTRWEDTRLDLKPHERVLEEGDLMAVCSYIVYRGYWSHGQRTGTMSRPSEYLAQTYQIAVGAQDAGIAAMRPGVPAGDIARAVREKVEESGWQLQGGRIGHGTGLDYSERPVPAEQTAEFALVDDLRDGPFREPVQSGRVQGHTELLAHAEDIRSYRTPSWGGFARPAHRPRARAVRGQGSSSSSAFAPRSVATSGVSPVSGPVDSPGRVQGAARRCCWYNGEVAKLR